MPRHTTPAPPQGEQHERTEPSHRATARRAPRSAAPLRGLEAIADEIDRWDADEATHVLGEIVGFLRAHLAPHARAEEQVLYPAVEEAMAAAGAPVTMRADHVEIVSRID